MCFSATALIPAAFAFDEHPYRAVDLEGDVAVTVSDLHFLRDFPLEGVVPEHVLEEPHEVHDRVALVGAALASLSERSGEAVELARSLLV